ncbi:hypothetical protein IFO70_23845 [Phormidium tenue FACHB-886]|nr:hypothetical protein [Phormidium tenue FACHB-886]
MYQLQILQDTILKQSTNQALQLTDRQKCPILQHAVLSLSSYALQAKHIKFSLGKDSAHDQMNLAGRNTWFALLAHAGLLKDSVAIAPFVSPSTSQPGTNNHLLMSRSEACDQKKSNARAIAPTARRRPTAAAVASGVPMGSPWCWHSCCSCSRLSAVMRVGA